jgi:hypothetical protein
MPGKFLVLAIPTPLFQARAQLPHVMAGTVADFSAMVVMASPEEMVAMPVESEMAAMAAMALSVQWAQRERLEPMRVRQAEQAERGQRVAPGATAAMAEH